MKKSTISQALIPSADFYNNVGIGYEHTFGHDAGLHAVLGDFLGRLPPDALVLDCGCGTGKPVSKAIVDSGRHVHGLDFSKTMVELSRKQVTPGIFETVNMLDYAPTKRFDGIVAMLSLFDLSREEITSMAHKWSGWLLPGGFLLIGVFGAEDCPSAKPQMFDEDGKCARGIPFMFMGHEVSMTLFTKAGWVELLESAGLRVVHRNTDVFAPPPDAQCDPEPHYFVIAEKPSLEKEA